jgi:hypothetical protein
MTSFFTTIRPRAPSSGNSRYRQSSKGEESSRDPEPDEPLKLPDVTCRMIV